MATYIWPPLPRVGAIFVLRVDDKPSDNWLLFSDSHLRWPLGLRLAPAVGHAWGSTPRETQGSDRKRKESEGNNASFIKNFSYLH
jgi:hypothetical protein